MADRLSRERRSWNMNRIRGKDTTPAKLVRSLLHQMGYLPQAASARRIESTSSVAFSRSSNDTPPHCNAPPLRAGLPGGLNQPAGQLGERAPLRRRQ
jgi:hypothetical protein